MSNNSNILKEKVGIVHLHNTYILYGVRYFYS